MAITEEKALIKIASETSGAQIRYTINGEDPTESDTLYTSSGVELDYGDVLRAKAFKSGSMPSATSCYKNGFHNVTFEKVSDLDFLWNGTYKGSSYSYKGYDDSNDYIHKFLYLNGTYFIIGFDSQTLSQNGATYNSKTFIKYSNDLKTWQDMKLPTTRQQYNNYWYRYIPMDIIFFNNKYVVIGTYEHSSYNPETYSSNKPSFDLQSFSSSLYSNTEFSLYNGNYMLIYDNVSSTPIEYAMNDETLGCNINGKGGSYLEQLLIVNDRLYIITAGSSTLCVIYTKDLDQYTSFSGVIPFLNSSNNSFRQLSQILYKNGKYWLATAEYYRSNSNNNYYYNVVAKYSYDLKTWTTDSAGIFSSSSGTSSVIPLISNSFTINDSIYFNEENGNDLYQIQINNTSVAFRSRQVLGYFYFPFEDSIIYGSRSDSSTLLNLLNLNSNVTTTSSSPYEIINSNSVFYYIKDNMPLLKTDEAMYCILYIRGSYNSTAGATLEGSWPYNKYSVFKINID